MNLAGRKKVAAAGSFKPGVESPSSLDFFILHSCNSNYVKGWSTFARAAVVTN